MQDSTPPRWLDKDLYRFQSRFLEIDGNRIHYVDEGHGPVILLLDGNPTCSSCIAKSFHDCRANSDAWLSTTRIWSEFRAPRLQLQATRTLQHARAVRSNLCDNRLPE
jgi:hypothetical protein